MRSENDGVKIFINDDDSKYESNNDRMGMRKDGEKEEIERISIQQIIHSK